MAEPGHWEGPDDTATVEALMSAGLPWGGYLNEVLIELEQAGLLVRKRYYVRSPRELYTLYSSIGMHLHRGMNGALRWVMCRESYEAVLLRERDRRAVVASDIRATWLSMTGDVLPATEPVPVANVDFRTQTAYLFRIPVRIDPAARSPLLEIDTEATMRRH